MGQYQPSVVKKLVQFLYLGEYNDPSTETAPSARQTPAALRALHEHMRVHGLADFWQVAALAAQARAAIGRLLGPAQDDAAVLDGLPAAVEEAVRSSGDAGLLAVLAGAAAAHVGRLVDVPGFRRLLGVDRLAAAGFPFMVLQPVVRALLQSREECKGLEEKIKVLEAEVERLQSSERAVNRQLDEFRNGFKALWMEQGCRNQSCIGSKGVYFDDAGGIIRCSKCKCRHYYSG